MRSNGFQRKEGRFISDIRKKVIMIMVRHWHRLTREVDDLFLELFKLRLNESLDSLV